MHTTRQRLLLAAVDEFREHGWEGSSGLAIRKRAGVSQGSWAHAFPGGKPQVAAELYRQYFTQIFGPVLETLTNSGSGGNAAIARAVGTFLRMIEEHKPRAALLYKLEAALLQTGEAKAVREERASITLALRGVQVAQGGPQMPSAALYAVAFGPAETYCRQWLDELHDERPSRAAGRLGAAAARALPADE